MAPSTASMAGISVTGAVGRQEAAATHAGVAIAVAGGLALRQLELAHRQIS